MKISKFNQSQASGWEFRVVPWGSRFAVEARNPWYKRFEPVTTFSTQAGAEDAVAVYREKLK